MKLSSTLNPSILTLGYVYLACMSTDSSSAGDRPNVLRCNCMLPLTENRLSCILRIASRHQVATQMLLVLLQSLPEINEIYLNLTSIVRRFGLFIQRIFPRPRLYNSGTPGVISTKLGTHIAICMCKNVMSVCLSVCLSTYLHIYPSSISIKMEVCLCVFVCLSITLDGLERFRPNLVHILLYVCVRILCISIYLSSIYITMGVCVCPGITLERLERFRPNLVHTLLYVCVRILRISIYLSSISIKMDVCVLCMCVYVRA
jgi:hypothetical protein